jgi:hypothetical protein
MKGSLVARRDQGALGYSIVHDYQSEEFAGITNVSTGYNQDRFALPSIGYPIPIALAAPG